MIRSLPRKGDVREEYFRSRGLEVEAAILHVDGTYSGSINGGPGRKCISYTGEEAKHLFDKLKGIYEKENKGTK